MNDIFAKHGFGCFIIIYIILCLLLIVGLCLSGGQDNTGNYRVPAFNVDYVKKEDNRYIAFDKNGNIVVILKLNQEDIYNDSQ